MILRIIVLGGLAAALLAAGAATLAWLWQPAAEANTPPVRPVASTIMLDQPSPSHSVPGVIAARIEVALGFQTLGRVTARNVDIGDIIRRGDVLATLNPDDLRGDVQAAQAALETARVEFLTTQATAERTRALARRNVASTAQLEQVERTLAAAQASLLQAQSELIRANDAAGFAEMKAPFDGVISAVYANAGAIVSAGEPVVQLSAEEGLEAVIDLPEAVLSRVKLGSHYQVWSENDDQNLQPATVSQIEPVADALTRTRRVHLSLANDNSFRLGALIRARPVGSGQALISLPHTAVLERNGQPMVWIVSRGGTTGTVTLRDIVLAGPAVNGQVGVTSGIAAGDEVVIRGIHSLSEGQPVGRSVPP